MKERPILFSSGMVRELLAGRKTQTRRPVKPPPAAGALKAWHHSTETATGRQVWGWQDGRGQALDDRVCPYGAPGDRLWVRETWLPFDPCHFADPGEPRDHLSDRYGVPRRNGAAYRADSLAKGPEDREDGDSERCRHELGYPRWKPGIHMPRWASRLLLEVESVRVERLHAITEDDARAEGMETFRAMPPQDASCRETLLRRWDGMYGGTEHAASENPWVWVVTFRRVDAARSAA